MGLGPTRSFAHTLIFEVRSPLFRTKFLVSYCMVIQPTRLKLSRAVTAIHSFYAERSTLKVQCREEIH